VLVHDFESHQIRLTCLVEKPMCTPNHGKVWMWGTEYFQILSQDYIFYSSLPSLLSDYGVSTSVAADLLHLS
jgi:hypothetical protein